MSPLLIGILVVVAIVAVLGFGWLAAPIVVLALVGAVWLGVRAARGRVPRGEHIEPLDPPGSRTR
jgi:hypothetical protein